MGKTVRATLLQPRTLDEPSGVGEPPGLVLLTGLDGSCSRVLAADPLNSTGVFFDVALAPLDSTVAPLKFQHTLNYDVEKLPRGIRKQVGAEVDILLSRFNCSQRLCAFRSEGFLSQLPLYRSVMAERGRRRLCVVHYVSDPVQWVLAHNWRALHKYYTALLGAQLPPERSAQWFKTPEGEWYTTDKGWVKLKSMLWNRMEQEIISWILSTQHEPLVRNFWLRCHVDPVSEILAAAMAACGGPAEPAAVPRKGQGTWEADRLFWRPNSAGGEGVLPARADPRLRRSLLPIIMEITQDTAKHVGLTLESGPVLRDFVKATSMLRAPHRMAHPPPRRPLPFFRQRPAGLFRAVPLPWNATSHHFRTEPESRVLVYPAGKLAFCYIEKNACTQFNFLFNSLNGRAGRFWQSSLPNSGLKMTDITRENGWRWAVFVRDPLARYLSAWASKCVDLEDQGSECVPRGRFSRPEVEGFEMNVRANHANQRPLRNNAHWAPQQDFCGGLRDASGYDFVGNLSGDVHGQVKSMLEMVGVEAEVERFFPQDGGPVGHSTNMDPALFYRDIAIQRMVMHMYHMDFNLPGLQRPSHLGPEASSQGERTLV